MTRRAETDPAAAPAARLRLSPTARHYATAFGYVALSTVVAEILYRTLDSNRLSMIFLAAVLLAAVRLGRGPAFFAAVLGFVVYNFYLVEPRFILWFGSAEDYFVLVAFLAVALLTGGLAGRLRDENQASLARARRMATLFEATREMSAVDAEDALRERVAARLAEAVSGPAWVIPAGAAGEPEAWAALAEQDHESLARLLRTGAQDWPGAETLTDGPWRMRSLVADGRRMGLAIWRGPGGHAGPEAEDLTRVMAEVGAQALGRARLGAEKAAAETVAGAERLRTALLSSISHDFRTPLAAILASATSLIAYEDSFDAATRKDLLSTIQEEAERLNRFVANLLNMTRLESGVLELNIAPVPVQEAAGPGAGAPAPAHRLAPGGADGAGRARARQRRPGAAGAGADQPDRERRRLQPRRLGAQRPHRPRRGRRPARGRRPGRRVPPADLPRIFDKFYRASNARQSAQGAGLGLSICRGLVEAMGGAIEARARPDGGPGLSVVVHLQEA